MSCVELKSTCPSYFIPPHQTFSTPSLFSDPSTQPPILPNHRAAVAASQGGVSHWRHPSGRGYFSAATSSNRRIPTAASSNRRHRNDGVCLQLFVNHEPTRTQ
ncbi:hypothetical protein OROGR_014902 [Orobanche gracilis]